MLQTGFWSKLLTGLVIVIGIVLALPNVPAAQRLMTHLPAWIPTDPVNLGLDLQGGSSLLIQVDIPEVYKEKAESLLADIRSSFRKAHIGYKDIGVTNGVVQVRVTDMARYADAKKALEDLNPGTGGSVLSVGARAYDMTEPGNGLFVLRMTDGYKTQTQLSTMSQSIVVVNKRINDMGTREPSVAQDGDNRILIEVPGLKDPDHLKALLGKVAKMDFRLVDQSVDPNATVIPPTDEVLPDISTKPPTKLVVQKRIMVNGERLTDAAAGFDQQTGQPIVTLRFDSVGAREFADLTKEFPPGTQRFAVVLDEQVITAPVMNEPILTGNGQISGSFTTQSANDLATLLRAGSLPASVSIISENTVGAGLGADSIHAGSLSAIAGLACVALFMILRYGLFGLFADVALTLNIVLLLALLTVMGATLTLPGIAGIVLTMGMAVDANVLVYERIREEQRNGRGMIASIDVGFRRAMATIFDANATHLIAALILFELGSGPVRGFAITLGIGIITSFFTSVVVTRLIVVSWLNAARPRKLTI